MKLLRKAEEKKDLLDRLEEALTQDGVEAFLEVAAAEGCDFTPDDFIETIEEMAALLPANHDPSVARSRNRRM